MFKALFNRKKQTQPAPTRQVDSAPAKAELKSSLEVLLSELSGSEGRKRDVSLARLAELVDKGEAAIDAVANQLQPNEMTMLKLSVDSRLWSTLDQSLLADIACTGFSSELRLQAVQWVTDSEQLKRVAKSAKGSDKSIYRAAKSQLEALQEQAREQAAIQTKQQAIVSRIETLARVTNDPLLEAQLKGLQEQWREVSAFASEELNVQFEAAQEIITQHILTCEQQRAAEQAQHEAVAHADEVRQLIIAAMDAEFVECVNAPSVDRIESALQKLLLWQQEWRESEHHRKATKEEDRQFHKVCTVFELSLTRLKHFIQSNVLSVDQDQPLAVNDDATLHEIDDWLHDIERFDHHELPLVQRLKAALTQHQQSLTEHRQKEIEQVRGVRSQIRRCQAAISEGHLRRASGLHQGIEEKLGDFDISKHPGIKKQLDETTAELEKLRDWQAYAVLPKKQALIERMQLLITQSITPDDRAQAIREMQDEWKLLSRGLQSRQQDLWEQFHELAQQAYEPCRDYFNEQRNLRNINLEKRKEVVAELRHYAESIDWQNPSVKDIDQVLQVARNDWRRYSPVDRAASKSVQKQFDECHQKLYALVKAEHETLKEAKRSIIARAETLLSFDDLRAATDAAKQLQTEWKNLETLPRKEEQALWHAFRSVCDQLFAKRDEQSAAFKADLEAHKMAAEALIAEIEALTTSDDVLAERQHFDQLVEAYQCVGALPKKTEPAITQRYRKACSGFEKRCKAARIEQADQHWQALFQWVEQVRFGALSHTDAEAQWRQLKVPKMAQGLIDRIDIWQQPVSEENQALLHERTIDLEILAGVESPSQDADARMNLQVQRLSQGFGSAAQPDFEQNVIDWLATGSVDSEWYQTLQERMKTARSVWLQQKSQINQKVS